MKTALLRLKMQNIARGTERSQNPFKLSGQGRAERRKQLEAKFRAEELRECTFNPKTTESRNKKLISEFLAEDDSEIGL